MQRGTPATTTVVTVATGAPATIAGTSTNTVATTTTGAPATSSSTASIAGTVVTATILATATFAVHHHAPRGHVLLVICPPFNELMAWRPGPQPCPPHRPRFRLLVFSQN